MQDIEMIYVEAFAGISGASVAAQTLGMRHLAFCENEPYCQKVLAQNYPGTPICDDISAFDIEWLRSRNIERPDLYIAGWPCQPFSDVNVHRKENDERVLWPDALRSIDSIRPTWVIGENVNGFIKRALDDVLEALGSIGYTAQTYNISASGAGAYHQRYRVFILAHANVTLLPRRPEPGNYEEERKNAEGLVPHMVPSNLRLEIPQPGLYRSGYGFSERVHRIKALGNAIVPAQIWYLLRAIKVTELVRREAMKNLL